MIDFFMNLQIAGTNVCIKLLLHSFGKKLLKLVYTPLIVGLRKMDVFSALLFLLMEMFKNDICCLLSVLSVVVFFFFAGEFNITMARINVSKRFFNVIFLFKHYQDIVQYIILQDCIIVHYFTYYVVITYLALLLLFSFYFHFCSSIGFTFTFQIFDLALHLLLYLVLVLLYLLSFFSIYFLIFIPSNLLSQKYGLNTNSFILFFPLDLHKNSF